MNFSEIFIRRPIATSLLMLAIVLFGIVSYRALPVSDLPNIDYPTISVNASLPGADPSTMASAVATPLERQFTAIAGLDSMTSTSSVGSTQITMQFDLSRDIDGATVDVETAINAATPLLPPGMPNPPSFRKQNPADYPVVMLGLTSKTLRLSDLNEYAQTVVAQRISAINGVSQVMVQGQQKYAIRVQVDPYKLAARQIGINEVAQAVQDWNVNLPTGTLVGPHKSFNVQTSGQLMDADSYKPLVVAWRNGAPIRLEQVANVIDSVEDNRTTSWMFTKEGSFKAINLMVMRQPGTNTIQVIDDVRKLIPTFQAQLPPSVQLFVRNDRAKTIREGFKDIKLTLGLSLGLVITVIYLFLRNASATMIPSLALPVSIVGTFSVMYLLNYSLDNLSMMALILSVGFVVDDAIVMLENIVRRMEKGESAMEAALHGSKEIGFTIVSMTVSLAAVFIPVLFLGGILGRLFREFAVTICVAIMISGIVSITLTPMLCSRFLRHSKKSRQGGLFNLVRRGYELSLGWVLHHRPVMAGVFAILLAATAYLYVKVPKGFIPDQDNDYFMVTTEAAQGTSYRLMASLQDRVNNILKADPNIDSFSASVGGGMGPGGGGNSNQGRMQIQLTPRATRKLSSAQVMEQLRPKVSGIPGMRVFMSMPPTIRMGGRMSKSAYELTVQGPDTAELYREAEKLQAEIARIPSIQDVTSDAQLSSPRVNVEIDRDKAAALQLNAQQIESALYQGFGPSWISTIYTPVAQNRVLLEVDPQFQDHSDSLSALYFKSSQGRLVPLDAISKVTQNAGPTSIARSGQLPSVTISFNLKPGVALGDAVDQVQAVAKRVLPDRMSTSFTGTAKAFQSSLVNLSLLLTVAVLVVYIVLGVLYESYIHPITILSGLPSAGFGALLTLILFKVDLSIYAFVGLMMLIGIVMKNAIMQIDFALDAERRSGKTPLEAIFEGCITRFRPIMMTTMSALLGALPMALGYGSGGEARRPLGLAVVGGLLFSQMVTLYLTPVVYIYMSGFTAKRKLKQRHTKPVPGELAPAQP